MKREKIYVVRKFIFPVRVLQNIFYVQNIECNSTEVEYKVFIDDTLKEEALDGTLDGSDTCRW